LTRVTLESKLRGYAATISNQSIRTAEQEPQVESFVDEQWVSTMMQEADALDGIDFELPGEKVFTFGIGDKYRESLKSKNANLESYFDQYVDRDGNWNHEQFNMHRTVVDNIDEIVRAVYQQGMSDGQRRVVETARKRQGEYT